VSDSVRPAEAAEAVRPQRRGCFSKSHHDFLRRHRLLAFVAALPFPRCNAEVVDFDFSGSSWRRRVWCETIFHAIARARILTARHGSISISLA
jgi:hypothetical protein